jgi:hypothetical protein
MAITRVKNCWLVQHLSTATASGLHKVCSSCGLDEHDICKAYVVEHLPQMRNKLTQEDLSSLRQQHAEQLIGSCCPSWKRKLSCSIQCSSAELADKATTVAKLKLAEVELQQQLAGTTRSLQCMRWYETITNALVKEVGTYAHIFGCLRCQLTWVVPLEHAPAKY